MSKILVIYSGGMDSYTALHKAIRTGNEVHAINFYYGQKHEFEMKCAKEVCEKNNIPLKVADVSVLGRLASNSALTGDKEIPKGHYEDESMKDTVVPNRNMVLIALAASHAITIGATELWYGAHSGDHAIYPDCRPAFVDAMANVLALCDYKHLTLRVPFLHGNKESILKEGFIHGLDYSETWTCYDPQWTEVTNNKRYLRACGKCGSCTERLEAFAAHNETDPLEYV